ncbi:hypothetical protein M885DRAFT_525316 [Pelagophyceae sp. CCMP2097]|nr:hypothetical protein M885DRAFT_525316 [Pelagophyceae sp. CCMP2097]
MMLPVLSRVASRSSAALRAPALRCAARAPSARFSNSGTTWDGKQPYIHPGKWDYPGFLDAPEQAPVYAYPKEVFVRETLDPSAKPRDNQLILNILDDAAKTRNTGLTVQQVWDEVETHNCDFATKSKVRRALKWLARRSLVRTVPQDGDKKANFLFKLIWNKFKRRDEGKAPVKVKGPNTNFIGRNYDRK